MLIGASCTFGQRGMTAASDAEIVHRETGRLVFIQTCAHVGSFLLKPD
jgi:hypothetical protein